MEKRLRGGHESGSVLLGALGAALAGIICFMTMQSMIASTKTQLNLQVASSASIHVLDSALNLTIAGIKNRWCFSGSMLSDPNCSLTHQGNVERLLISQDTVKFVQASLSEGVDYTGQISISQIQRSVSLSQITKAHPLYTMIESIPLDDIKAIVFSIKKVNQITEPTRSREILLDLEVRFDSANPDIAKLKAQSRIAVFPRELAGMALILPNHLSLSGDAPSAAYDSSIPAAEAGAKGLSFMSPVLINGDLELSKSSGDTNSVTFTDRIYLGGSLRKAGAVFVPASAGGSGADVISAAQGGGGIRGGIEFEPARDAGLDALAGIQANVVVEADLMNLCKERQTGRLELVATDKMRLLVRPSEADSALTEFTLGHINSLLPQESRIVQVRRMTGSLDATLVPGGRPDSDLPTVRMVIEVNGYNGQNLPQSFLSELALGDGVEVSVGPTAKILVQVEPVLFDPDPASDAEPNRFNVRVSSTGSMAGVLSPYPIASGQAPFVDPYVRVSLEPFDYGFRRGVNRRTTTNLQEKNKVNGFTYRYNGTSLVRVVGPGPSVQGWFGCQDMDGTNAQCMDRLVSTVEPKELENLIGIEGLSYAALDKACGRVNAFGDSTGEYPAFEGTQWASSFASQAPVVWGFTEFDTAGTILNGYNPGTLILDANNSSWTPSRAQFHVRARLAKCQVEATAEFVTGFFVCDEFVIASRTTPLVITGTVIAKRISVDPAALKAGVQWRSIFHPQSVLDLQRAQILFAMDDDGVKVACSMNEAEPVWLPNLSKTAEFDHYNCSPAVLRSKADPFRWTAVDPDCGLPTGTIPGTAFSCKRRIVRVLVKELSRSLSL